MKKILMWLVLLSGAIVCGTAHAKGVGPEVVAMKTLVAPFPHWKHQALNSSECFHCHSDEGGKIKGLLGKETAHELCISCHDMNDKGPVECKQCHK